VKQQISATGTMARGVIAAGFDGTAFDAAMPALGAYVLFGRNVRSMEQVRALTDALRAHAIPGEPPPLIAIDQEGGRVARLRFGVEAMPPMMSLGAAADLELAARAGEQTGFDLSRAGCTLDFAPVLDLALEPRNTVIGTRSPGSDPRAVAAIGDAYAQGLTRYGVAACFKHFPGHGSTDVDSHLALPVVSLSEAALRMRDMLPFASVAPHALAMMGTHALIRAFDPELPVTLSSRAGIDVLRNELGFAGVYVTDSLEMGALDAFGGPVAAGVAALRAGADLLTVSHSIDVATALALAIERAVEDGTLPLDRLREAYERVVSLRRTMAEPPRLPLEDTTPHPGVGREIARRAITLVRGFARVDPIASIAVSFHTGVAPSGAEDVATSGPSLSHEAPALKTIECYPDADPNAEHDLLEAIAASQRRPLLLTRRAHLHEAQRAIVERTIERYRDAVVVSMLEPFDLPLFGSARHLLAAYGDDAASIGGLADVLFGGSLPSGVLPVALELPA
jgi:beta-N-acetylhexosaminidase